MNSIEFLEKEIKNEDHHTEGELGNSCIDVNTLFLLLKQAKLLHKQEIIDAWENGQDSFSSRNAEQYYQETFVSNGSGDHISDVSKMVELPKQEISDESWQGCDGCTEQDEVMYKNGYVKGYNAAIAELPKEISDEEIAIKFAEWIRIKDFQTTTKDNWIGLDMQYYTTKELYAKWYREQLKSKGNGDHISDISKMVELPQKEISDENTHLSKMEITDEEICRYAEIEYPFGDYDRDNWLRRRGFIKGMIKYREKFKQRQ